MRTWWKLCVFVLLSFSLSLLPLKVAREEIITPPRPLVEQRADFKIAYKQLMKYEGFYSNHPHDYGGETYCGVTRTFSPEWRGWLIVDEYKKHYLIKWNDSIPNPLLNYYVLDYYLGIWVNENFMYIKDQEIANYVMDLRVNATIGVKIIQETVNEMGCRIKVTNFMTKETVSAINSLPKWEFLARLMNNRITFYTSIVDRRSSQVVFLNHWVKRIRVN